MAKLPFKQGDEIFYEGRVWMIIGIDKTGLMMSTGPKGAEDVSFVDADFAALKSASSPALPVDASSSTHRAASLASNFRGSVLPAYYVQKDIFRSLCRLMAFLHEEKGYDPALPIEFDGIVEGRRVVLTLAPQEPA